MTLRFPQPGLFDKILRRFGKKRAVFIPQNAHEKYGYDVYLTCHTENFFKALFRPKDARLPEGSVDLYSLQDSLKNHSED